MATESSILDAALDTVESEAAYTSSDKVYDITVKNDNNGSKVQIPANADNWLVQVFEGTAKDVGFNLSGSKPIYYNERGESTSDSNLTLAEFGIGPNSLLRIAQEGGVA